MVKLKNIFEKNDLELLSMLKGKELRKVLVDYPWCHNKEINLDLHLVTHVLMEFDAGWLLLQNKIVDEPKDNDEYSAFKIRVTSHDVLKKNHKIMKTINNKPVFDRYEPFKWFEFEVGQNVTNIEIYRDHAKWSYNGNIWDITTDVAIRLSSENHIFLFVLQDTLAQLINVYYNYSASDNDLINMCWSSQEWGMKAENIDALNRITIEI